MSLTSTTAPGKVFGSREELARHYKSDWHRYNLKRREAGLPVLLEADFLARLEAARSLRAERQQQQGRHHSGGGGGGTDHIKNKKKKQPKKKKENDNDKKEQQQQQQRTSVSEAHGYDDRAVKEEKKDVERDDGKDDEKEEKTATATATAAAVVSQEEEEDEDERQRRPDGEEKGVVVEDDEVDDDDEEDEEEGKKVTIDPNQCLFDDYVCANAEENAGRMGRLYGFFLPDREYLTDLEGLLGYCHEKIKLGRTCLYCHRVFPSSVASCRRHMLSKNHTKLRYESGYDLEDLSLFYDFDRVNRDFLRDARNNKKKEQKQKENGQKADDDDGDDQREDDDDGSWEDVTDDDEDDDDEDDDDSSYFDEGEVAASLGYDVTVLGELVFPDGRIVGHRSLKRYYRQRPAPLSGRGVGGSSLAAVSAARNAASERLYRGRVYNLGQHQQQQQPSNERQRQLALLSSASHAGILPKGTVVAGRRGRGVVSTTTTNNNNNAANGTQQWNQMSLYRYRALVRKERREERQAMRTRHRTTLNTNRMDKKANNLMNGVCVAKSLR